MTEKSKLRTVVTTDGEIDDMNSFIRLLLYSNDMDVAGIILTSSMFHYSGNDTVPPYRWTGETWISEMINRYEKVYSNLLVHDSSYPTPESLRAVYRIGNITSAGEMEEETEGSNFLVDLLLDDDERPIYIQTWGGTNTTARALKTIQETYQHTPVWEAIKNKVESKVVLYIILDQDSTYHDYIEKNWNLTVLNDVMNFGYFAYGWKNLPEEFQASLDAKWHTTHLKNKGALLEQYALIGDGYYLDGEMDSEQFGQSEWLAIHPNYSQYDFISEGDSLSYFYLLQSGLRNAESPVYGGWGGRFSQSNPGNFSTYHTVDYNPLTKRFEQEYTFYRWIKDIQADFAARANWCITDNFEEASHYPELVMSPEDRTGKAGERITLKALAKDPNELEVNYHWWCYHEASTYWDFSHLSLESHSWQLGDMEFIDSWYSEQLEPDWQLKLENENTPEVSFTIPEDAKKGDTIHFILEVQNQATLPLKTYKRVIITVA